MKKFLFVLILSLALISTATAQPMRDVTWTPVGDALHPFCRAGSGVLGNYFYCFGGADSCWGQAFNLTTELWEESTAPPLGGSAYGSAATNDAIYLIGWYSPGGFGGEMQKFTPIGGGPNGTWTQMAPYPIRNYGMAAAWDGGNFIYTAGGPWGWTIAYKYDIANDNWTPMAGLPVLKAWAGGAFVNGKFYVVGGYALSSSSTLEYDPSTNSWTEKASPPVTVSCASFSTTFNDSLVFSVGGGFDQPGSPAINAVQVYNPLTNAWSQETPLPEAHGSNAARFVSPDKVISAGGTLAGQVFAVTYKGTGFPSGSPSSHLTVNLVPFVQPVQIPASGGTFDFYAFVNNTATFSQEVDLWTMEIAPDGSTIGPILGPATVTMDTGTRGWYRHQNVPGTAAPGLYTYIAYAGNYLSGNIWATDSLQFTKLTTGDGPWVNNWKNWGDAIGDEEVPAALIAPEEHAVLKASPNPFNPSTAISYRLSADSHVSLQVYDTAGRLVETLLDGWRDAGIHEATFDGSQLASGIYFAQLRAGNYSQVQKLILLK